MEDRQRARLPTDTLQRARSLRAASTDAEHALWRKLRSGQLAGLKFRRQYPVPPYIVDFCCIAMQLVIEIDGSQHTPHTEQVRTALLESKGFTVLRFWNNDLLQRTDAVMEAIWNACTRTAPHPNPSPVGRGA
jgi:very-short-patch-repair endonuclease